MVAISFFILCAVSCFCCDSINARPVRSVDVVVTHFDESVSEIEKLLQAVISHTTFVPSIRLFIYSKNEFSSPNITVPGYVNNTSTFYNLNVGREGDSILRYILQNFESLPDFTLFTQAQPNNFNFWPQQLQAVTTETRMLALGYVANCSCNGCFVREGAMVRLREVYALAVGGLCLVDFMTYFNGQFLVSRIGILAQPKSFYRLLFDALHAGAGHPIHSDYCNKSRLRRLFSFEKPEVCALFDGSVKITDHLDARRNNNPLFVHVLERSWTFIFGCAHAQNAVCTQNPKTIWLLWLDGWERAPWIVQRVRESWESLNPAWTVQLLDENNIAEFVTIVNRPQSAAAFSDIIRLSLLAKYGGVWADATMLCMVPLDFWMHDTTNEAGVWMYHGRGGGEGPASWFIIASLESYIMAKWKEKADEYWTNRSVPHDYFWMHRLFKELYDDDEKFRSLWKSVPYIWCDAFGQAHMLATRVMSYDANLVAVLRNQPPYAVKLSHHGFNHTVESNGKAAIYSAMQPRESWPFHEMHAAAPTTNASWF